jgi:acyl-CoA synthetase (AMP-forming)/AMP-acid ligase II
MLEISVGEALRKAFQSYKNRVAFEVDGVEYTYQSVQQTVNRLANGLLELGLRKGDRIVIMTTNRIEYVFTDLAAAILGLVKVPLNVMLNNKDIDYRIRDSEARAVVLDDFFVKKTNLFFRTYDFLERIIYVPERDQGLPPGVINFNELIEKPLASDPGIKVEPNDPLAIMYTGGTTGEPKGVVHTDKSCLSIFFNIIVTHEINSEDEVMLLTAPLPHATGFFIPSGLFRGARIIITKGFNLEEFFKLVEEKRVTWTFTVPTMIYAMVDHPARTRHDLSSLRTLIYGGAPILPRRLEEALLAMGPIFLQGYSQMEVSCNTTMFTKRQHMDALKSSDKKKLQSCGLPMLMAQVKIVREDGNEVSVGEIGEIITRGPHMMAGYWRKEEETRETIVDGWIHTGDLATVDEDGYIYVVDRKKDMIITGGLNVYSKEVEDALSRHPDVSEVIVIGTPDPKWGEQVMAIVARKQGSHVTEQTLIEYCKEHVSAYKVPKRIEFRESLPKTPYGKYDKKAVRGEYWKGYERQI